MGTVNKMMNLDVKQVVVPDGYIKIVVKEITDIPEMEEEEAISYTDLTGDTYCFFEGGVYIHEK